MTPIRPGSKQLHHLGAVVEVRACAVAEREPGTAVAELEVVLDGVWVLGGHHVVGELQFLANPLVPVLGERLGQLHTDAVHFEVVAVGVRGEQLVGEVRDGLSHRHQLERQHIHLATLSGQLTRSDEVGDAQEPVALLTREGEPEPFRRIVRSESR